MHAHHPKSHAVALLAAALFGLAPLVVTRHVVYRVGRNPFSAWKYRSRRIEGYAAVCGETADRLAAAGVERVISLVLQEHLGVVLRSAAPL